MASYNIPILSIPCYYALAVFPHGVAIRNANKKDMKMHHNQNPKASSYHEDLKKRLTANEFAAFERAESCHRNSMENMPLYVAAIFAGLLAQSRVGIDQVGLNRFVYGWMAIRVLYTANYITTETRAWSYLRTLLYFAGTGWAFSVLGRSALVLGN